MSRKFKALGLATVAVLAMSAVVASAAQGQFTADSYPTTGTATSPKGNDVFSIHSSSVECAGHYVGTLKEASTTLTVTATYTNCRAFGFASATVHMNGCDYVFHDVGNNEAGRVSVECPAGKAIVITAGNCIVHIGTQTPSLGVVAYANVHPNVNVKANVTGITANVTQDGVLCPLNGIGHTLASYVQGAAIAMKPASGGNTLQVH